MTEMSVKEGQAEEALEARRSEKDLELALQLSMAEEEQRKADRGLDAGTEEFPELGSLGKGKGEDRA